MKTIAQMCSFLALEEPIESQQGGGRNFSNSISNLTIDSRLVQLGDGFIALQGEQVHGLDFLVEVLAKQPALILSDKKPSAEQQLLLAQSTVTEYVWVENIATRLGELANWFYDQPSQQLKVVGITGTNGKTSTAFYTAQLLTALGQKTALIGTLGNGVLSNGAIQSLAETHNTTPDAVSVHRLLAEFVVQDVDWVMMEVSSHALELGRVFGVVFETVALTQVTRDHIDFHGSLDAYQYAKKRLFTEYPARIKVLNSQDTVGQALIARLDSEPKHAEMLWRYAVINDKQAFSPLDDLYADTLIMSAQGMTFELSGQALREGEENKQRVFVPLLGAFNVENILCALSIVLASKLSTLEELVPADWNILIAELAHLQAVPGRMQPLKLSSVQPTVLIDFAHTPDALAQVLKAAKQHVAESTTGRLWVVFGCGGDRDQGKRPLMAQVVEQFADVVVVTNDNPRFENPEQIVAQIMTGFQHPKEVGVVLDRVQAIEQVLAKTTSDDVVLIAGKGHEDYQEIEGIKTPFQDEKVVLNWVSGVRK